MKIITKIKQSYFIGDEDPQLVKVSRNNSEYGNVITLSTRKPTKGSCLPKTTNEGYAIVRGYAIVTLTDLLNKEVYRIDGRIVYRNIIPLIEISMASNEGEERIRGLERLVQNPNRYKVEIEQTKEEK